MEGVSVGGGLGEGEVSDVPAFNAEGIGELAQGGEDEGEALFVVREAGGSFVGLDEEEVVAVFIEEWEAWVVVEEVVVEEPEGNWSHG